MARRPAPLNVMSYEGWASIELCPQLKEYVFMGKADQKPLLRGSSGVCSRSVCLCEREGLGNQCVWLKPSDAELERRTGEPHINGYPLYSGIPKNQGSA